jgi:hypothetical protein
VLPVRICIGRPHAGQAMSVPTGVLPRMPPSAALAASSRVEKSA